MKLKQQKKILNRKESFMSGCVMDMSFEQTTDPRNQSSLEKKEDSKPLNENGNKLRKCMTINKPMIPLKTSLFLWYGGEGTLFPFFNLYILQLGVSISQFSLIFILTPLFQFFVAAMSGIITDKTGRPKSVLVGNLLLTALAINSILLVPAIPTRKCFIKDVGEIQCNPDFSVGNFKKEARIINSSLECFLQCSSEKISYHAFTLYKTSLEEEDIFSNSSKSIPDTLNSAFLIKHNDVSSRNAKRIDSKTFCRSIMEDDCELFCHENITSNTSWTETQCPHVEDNSVVVITASAIILCLFSAVSSTCFRIMDVTSMFMVKTYNSDFGRERFWSILGITVLTPFGGYLVGLTTPAGGPKNCLTAIYFIDVIFFLLMISVYQLQVRINPPGRDMMKNTLKLLKNVDVMVFILSLLVLGTSRCFNEIYSFIYLDRLNAPSILIGLITGVNSLFGLLFLFTSDWWLRKVGSSNLLLCAFVGHVFNFLGYSFIENAWYALIFEATSTIFTYHLLWVTVVRHSHEIAPEGLAATIISCAGGTHWALGKGVGGLIGGQVMSTFGGRWAYRIMAVVCGIFGILYGVFLYFRRSQVKRKSYNCQEIPLNTD